MNVKRSIIKHLVDSYPLLPHFGMVALTFWYSKTGH